MRSQCANIVHQSTQLLSSRWLHSNAIQTVYSEEQNSNYELLIYSKQNCTCHFLLARITLWFFDLLFVKSNKVCKNCQFSSLRKITFENVNPSHIEETSGTCINSTSLCFKSTQIYKDWKKLNMSLWIKHTVKALW